MTAGKKKTVTEMKSLNSTLLSPEELYILYIFCYNVFQIGFRWLQYIGLFVETMLKWEFAIVPFDVRDFFSSRKREVFHKGALSHWTDFQQP
jgi:hypothetical protein